MESKAVFFVALTQSLWCNESNQKVADFFKLGQELFWKQMDVSKNTGTPKMDDL